MTVVLATLRIDIACFGRYGPLSFAQTYCLRSALCMMQTESRSRRVFVRCGFLVCEAKGFIRGMNPKKPPEPLGDGDTR